MDPQNIFFITGARRSGTTLLENVVCAYEGTNPALSEAQLITQLLRTFRWAVDPQNHADFVQHTFPRPDDLVHYFADMLSAYAEKTRAAYGGVPVLVFKNPEYCTVIDELATVLPHARFVVSVRDPRDQVASELEVMARRKAIWGLHGSRNIPSLTRNYEDYYERVLALADVEPERFHFVRYENLVQNFAETRAQLDQFTGLTGNCFDPHADWPRNHEQGMETPDYPTYSPLYGKAVDASRVSRYAEVLSASEIRSIEALCGDLMARFGYPMAAVAGEAVDAGSALAKEADSLLAGSRYASDMTQEELKALLVSVNALRRQVDESDPLWQRIDLLRRATRATLEWAKVRDEFYGS